MEWNDAIDPMLTAEPLREAATDSPPRPPTDACEGGVAPGAGWGAGAGESATAGAEGAGLGEGAASWVASVAAVDGSWLRGGGGWLGGDRATTAAATRRTKRRAADRNLSA